MEWYYNFLTSFSSCDQKPRLADLHSVFVINANETCQILVLHRKLTLVLEQSCTIMLVRVGLLEESLLYHFLCFKVTTLMAWRGFLDRIQIRPHFQGNSTLYRTTLKNFGDQISSSYGLCHGAYITITSIWHRCTFLQIFFTLSPKDIIPSTFV